MSSRVSEAMRRESRSYFARRMDRFEGDIDGLAAAVRSAADEMRSDGYYNSGKAEGALHESAQLLDAARAAMRRAASCLPEA